MALTHMPWYVSSHDYDMFVQHIKDHIIYLVRAELFLKIFWTHFMNHLQSLNIFICWGLSVYLTSESLPQNSCVLAKFHKRMRDLLYTQDTFA